MLNSLLTNILPLDLTISICTNFLFEGQKVLYRYTLATLELNKKYILAMTTKKDRAHCWRQHSLNAAAQMDRFLKNAFQANIKTNTGKWGGSKINFEKNNNESAKQAVKTRLNNRKTKDIDPGSGKLDKNDQLRMSMLEDKLYEIPNYVLDSKIIKFNQWTKIWKMLPTYVQFRKPEKIFASANDGYNLSTMYNNGYNFLDESDEGGQELVHYHYALMIIETSRDQIFGAFITGFPMHQRGTPFVGTAESFVFIFGKSGF